MIFFEKTFFLLLLIPLVLYLAIRPWRGRFANVLQLLTDLLLVCALSGMSLCLPDKEGVLYILCDRSHSMPPGSEKVMEKQIGIISRQMKNPPGVISFAGSSQLESAPGRGGFSGFKGVLSTGHTSDLAGALDFTLKMIPRDTPGRILLISDGNWNGRSPESSFSTALMRRIKVDPLPLSRSSFDDFAISGISGPLSVAPGEYCSLVCCVYAPKRLRSNCVSGKMAVSGAPAHSGSGRGKTVFSGGTAMTVKVSAAMNFSLYRLRGIR